MIARNPNNVKSSARLDMEIWREDAVFSKREIGAMIGWLNKALGGDQGRYLALAWLFDFLGKPLPDGKVCTELHTAQMEDKHWYAVKQWIGSYKDENGEWQSRPEFSLEATLVLTEAMKDYQKLMAGTPQNSEWKDSLTAQAVGQLGGVITNVAEIGNEAEIETWLPHEDVELPPNYPEKKQLVKPKDTDVEI